MCKQPPRWVLLGRRVFPAEQCSGCQHADAGAPAAAEAWCAPPASTTLHAAMSASTIALQMLAQACSLTTGSASRVLGGCNRQGGKGTKRAGQSWRQ